MIKLKQLVKIPPIPPTFLNGFTRFTKFETKSAKFAEKRAICITENTTIQLTYETLTLHDNLFNTIYSTQGSLNLFEGKIG